jgi:hypothetical protein
LRSGFAVLQNKARQLRNAALGASKAVAKRANRLLDCRSGLEFHGVLSGGRSRLNIPIRIKITPTNIIP